LAAAGHRDGSRTALLPLLEKNLLGGAGLFPYAAFRKSVTLQRRRRVGRDRSACRMAVGESLKYAHTESKLKRL